MGEVADRIRSFVEADIWGEDDGRPPWDDRTPILGTLLDSLGLMQLLDFLESEFGVAFDDEEVSVENFRTVAAIEALILSKRTAA